MNKKKADPLSQIKEDAAKLPEAEPTEGGTISGTVYLGGTETAWTFAAPKDPLEKAIEYAVGALKPSSIGGPVDRLIETTTEDGYRVVLHLSVTKE